MFTLCAHVHEWIRCSHCVSVFMCVFQGFRCMSVSVFAMCNCQCWHCVQVGWSQNQSTSTGVLMRSADSTAPRWSSKSTVVSTSPVMRMVCLALDQVYSQNERRMVCLALDQVYSQNERRMVYSALDQVYSQNERRMVYSASDQVYSQNERGMVYSASDQVYNCNETSQWKAYN